MRYGTWLGNGQSGGSYTGGPHRLVVHTTETSGLPGYQGGFTAPHITYDPEFGNFYQHTEFTTAARALANPVGGVQTNRRSAIQLEIICYSNKTIADQTASRQWVGDLTDENYEHLQGFVGFCHDQFGVKIEWPGKQALNYSQANAGGFRMTASEWNAFGGVCGHQHVPENTHWDPGAINWTKLLGGDMPLNETDLAAIKQLVRETINEELQAITIPGEPNHKAYQTVVNSSLHAKLSDGKKVHEAIDEAHARVVSSLQD